MPHFIRPYAAVLALALCAAPAASFAQAAAPAPAASPTTAPTPDPQAVQQLAINVLHQIQNDNLDRATFTDQMNSSLTDDKVRELSQNLSALGDPNSVELLSTKDAGGGVTVYMFLLRTDAGQFDETIALDASGKIAGLNFQNDEQRF